MEIYGAQNNEEPLTPLIFVILAYKENISCVQILRNVEPFTGIQRANQSFSSSPLVWNQFVI